MEKKKYRELKKEVLFVRKVVFIFIAIILFVGLLWELFS